MENQSVIPACAGMTPVAAGRRRRVALDSRLRGNDEGVGMIQGRRLYWLTSMSNCLILRCKLRRPNWIC